MSISRINYSPRIPEAVRSIGGMRLPDFTLIDVGASGGIETHWRALGDNLIAIGFDPLVKEVDRLNKIERNKGVRYEAGFIGFDEYEDLFPEHLRRDKIRSRNNQSFQRTSSVRATDAMKMDYVKEHFNSGEAVVYSDRRLSLDDYLREHRIDDVDFIKIDTDGSDYEVLLGSENTVRNCRVLGLSVEVQLHGADYPHSNVFSNIDKFLRHAGFSLFDLDIYRYSRGALPARFQYDIPAQTVSGQVQWGEAIYFRDLADPDYDAMHQFQEDEQKVLKLCCLFEIFGLPDCAAELLLKVGREGKYKLPAPLLLDALTPKLGRKQETYQEYVARFDRDPTAFYASRFNPSQPISHEEVSPIHSRGRVVPLLRRLIMRRRAAR